MPPVDAPSQLHRLYLVCKYYRALGITAAELEIVLAILIHQFDSPDVPLSNRMLAMLAGKVTRAVQIHVHVLSASELLIVKPTFRTDGGQEANTYDLSPLFAALEEVDLWRCQ